MREALAIDVDTSLSAERVIRVLEQVVAWRGHPKALRLDNGPGFIAERFMAWCAEPTIEVRHIQPRKLDQHAFIERYSRTYCTEVLNAYVLSHWIKCGRSPQNGCSSITKRGPMGRWRAYHPPVIGLNLKPEILLCHCLLDGGAYAPPNNLAAGSPRCHFRSVI